MRDIPFALLAIAAGVGIPIMAALNGAFGARLGSPVLASAVLTFVAFCGVLGVLSLTGLPNGGVRWPPVHVQYAAGLLATLYIVSITIVAPRIGVGNAIVLVLMGQVICAAIIDHFGLLGAPRVPVNLVRLSGLFLIILGVVLARKSV